MEIILEFLQISQITSNVVMPLVSHLSNGALQHGKACVPCKDYDAQSTTTLWMVLKPPSDIAAFFLTNTTTIWIQHVSSSLIVLLLFPLHCLGQCRRMAWIAGYGYGKARFESLLSSLSSFCFNHLCLFLFTSFLCYFIQCLNFSLSSLFLDLERGPRNP